MNFYCTQKMLDKCLQLVSTDDSKCVQVCVGVGVWVLSED